MNHMIAPLLLVIFLFGLSEACKDNRLIFRNELVNGRTLRVTCVSSENRRVVKDVKHHEVLRISFAVGASVKRFHWNWDFEQWSRSKMITHSRFRTYTAIFMPKCDKLRVYSARPDGIYVKINTFSPPERAFRWGGV
ncbi:putative plant self-incompatibility S1 [Arabidopsis thaliana]